MISISLLRNVFILICRQTLGGLNATCLVHSVTLRCSVQPAQHTDYSILLWTPTGALCWVYYFCPSHDSAHSFHVKTPSVNTRVTKAWSYTATAPHAFIVQYVTGNTEYFIPSLEPTRKTRSRVPPAKLQFVHLQEITSVPKFIATFTTSPLWSLTQNTKSSSYFHIPLL